MYNKPTSIVCVRCVINLSFLRKSAGIECYCIRNIVTVIITITIAVISGDGSWIYCCGSCKGLNYRHAITTIGVPGHASHEKMYVKTFEMERERGRNMYSHHPGSAFAIVIIIINNNKNNNSFTLNKWSKSFDDRPHRRGDPLWGKI